MDRAYRVSGRCRPAASWIELEKTQTRPAQITIEPQLLDYKLNSFFIIYFSKSDSVLLAFYKSLLVRNISTFGVSIRVGSMFTLIFVFEKFLFIFVC